MKKNCIVAQSGGPTCAINASLAGVLAGALANNQYNKIYGSLHGIQGVIRNDFIDLGTKFPLNSKELLLLKASPAMFLGSCRFKMPSFDENLNLYEDIFKIFSSMNIGTFFYIGGNDSMDTVDKLSTYAKQINSEVNIIGIPKTIDNDLVLTDHTPGFGSAAKYIATCLLEISHDTFIYDIPSITIVEIMGRDAGWLTAASALARNNYNTAPQLIYLPEVSFSKDKFIEDIKALMPTTQNIIIAVSEGIRDSLGNYISASTATYDKFGHAQLSGAGKCLEFLVKEHFDIKVRSVEINVLQRCAGHLTSKCDLDESFELGYSAATIFSNGETGKMVALTRTSNSPYNCLVTSVDVSLVANAAKSVPINWISNSMNDVTSDLIDYIKPLILGEVELNYINGLPAFSSVSHLS